MSRRVCGWPAATRRGRSGRPPPDCGCSRVTGRRSAHPIFARQLRRSGWRLPRLAWGSHWRPPTPSQCSGGLSAYAPARCGWCRRTRWPIPSFASMRSTCGGSTPPFSGSNARGARDARCGRARWSSRSRSAGTPVTRPEPAVPAQLNPSRSRLTAALGDAALVELIELDGELNALTLSGGHLARHRLGRSRRSRSRSTGCGSRSRVWRRRGRRGSDVKRPRPGARSRQPRSTGCSSSPSPARSAVAPWCSCQRGRCTPSRGPCCPACVPVPWWLRRRQPPGWICR